ncbi:MAG: type-F conjugative transfer system pilin assembly protein TrbC [Novosphingobium sp.]
MLLAGLLASSAPALAQESPATKQPTPQEVKSKNEGDAAMERLKKAVAQRKADEVPGPAELPDLPEAERRRAFEGLRKRPPSPAMDARARAALDKGKDALAAQREAMAKRLRAALGLEAPDMAAVAGATAPGPVTSWVPVLFVSSSMPVSMLRTYAAQLEKAGGVMAFRGMPGGLRQVGPMAKLSAEVLRLDPGCEGPACAMRGTQIIVDPLVFREHGVSVVPALAMVPGDPAQPYCERDELAEAIAPSGEPRVIYGDAALTGLLEEYARLGGAKEVAGVQARLEGR